MTTIFTIPGKPFGKQRPRFNRNSGRAYTPKETVSFENTVRHIAAQEIKAPLSGPVKLTIMATFEPAKSWSKKKTADHVNRPHIQKPDSDNVAKAIKDALNRIAYADDSQVSHLSVKKLWGYPARTVVIIEKDDHA